MFMKFRNDSKMTIPEVGTEQNNKSLQKQDTDRRVNGSPKMELGFFNPTMVLMVN
jgi:hypothetical protein